MTGEFSAFPNVSRESPALIFVNPAAGGGRTASCLSRIKSLLASMSFPAEFVLTESSEQLEQSARTAIATGRHLLFALGGDGTFQGLANAAFGSDVILGVLPAGGGNDLARALGLPKDPLAAAEAVLRGQPRWVDLVRARTADGRERLYAGGGGVGLDAEAARYASGTFRRIPGRFRYIASAIRAFSEHQPLNVHIEFPGCEFSAVHSTALLAGILNTPTYGGGLRLAPEAAVDDGFLEVVLIDDLRVTEVLKILPRLVSSGELHTPRIKRWRVKRVCLTTDRPCLFQGDGEIFGPAPLEIELLPKAIRVLAPVLA